MKTFLLVYFTISTILLTLWYIYVVHWQKKYKYTIKDWVFWSQVLELIFVWPITVAIKGYLLYLVLTNKVDGQIIVDEATDNYTEDQE